MKKKIIIGVSILLVIITIISIIVIKNISKSSDVETIGKIVQAKTETNTIIKTLTTGAEVTSGLSEKIELRAGYYYKEKYAEEDSYIKERRKNITIYKWNLSLCSI